MEKLTLKKFLGVFLAICLLTMAAAMADSASVTKGNGVTKGPRVKTSSIGEAAEVNVSSNSGNHSMYYQVRNGAGTPMSNYKVSTGNAKLTYLYDGYGESLGRTGYNYYLRIAHRSQCSCSSGTVANLTYTWEP